MMLSRFRETLDVPRLSVENEGGTALDDVASDGLLSSRVDGAASLIIPMKELNRALVRIFRGTSSKMEENVRRWLIRLEKS